MAINLLNETEVHRMQVLTKDLLPNPYRKMEKYHLQPERLNALARSIRDTSFWDNILARPNPDGSGTYQIAYGHHRLEAVRLCNIKEVNIPVKELSDTLMVKIMANENQSDWHMDTAVMNQTIWAVQDFIRDEIRAAHSVQGIKIDKATLSKIQLGSTVGRPILVQFLGSSWAHRIETALELRKLEDETSEDYRPGLLEATEEIKTPSIAKEFAKAARDYEIPKEDYKPLARKIQGNGTKTKPKMSAREAVKTVRDNRPKLKPLPGRDKLIEKIEKMMSDVDDAISSATNKMWWANQELKRLNVEEIGGLQAAFAMETFSKHIRVFEDHVKFFGFTLRNFTNQKSIGGGDK